MHVQIIASNCERDLWQTRLCIEYLSHSKRIPNGKCIHVAMVSHVNIAEWIGMTSCPNVVRDPIKPSHTDKSTLPKILYITWKSWKILREKWHGMLNKVISPGIPGREKDCKTPMMDWSLWIGIPIGIMSVPSDTSQSYLCTLLNVGSMLTRFRFLSTINHLEVFPLHDWLGVRETECCLNINLVKDYLCAFLFLKWSLLLAVLLWGYYLQGPQIPMDRQWSVCFSCELFAWERVASGR